jgi:catabolite repression protein CreC
VRQRGSVSSRLAPLQRPEAQTAGSGRLRSDSNLSAADVENVKGFPHAVVPRSRTAMLPPVLVRTLLCKSPLVASSPMSQARTR